MVQQQTGQDVRARGTQSDAQHAIWIAGRIETLLSHYYQPDNPSEVRDGAIDDWVEVLAQIPKGAIENACASWLREQPRRRPTPGDIRSTARSRAADSQNDKGDRSKLTFDQLVILEDKVLPSARRWRMIPGLREHGEKTLAYWGEA